MLSTACDNIHGYAVNVDESSVCPIPTQTIKHDQTMQGESDLSDDVDDHSIRTLRHRWKSTVMGDKKKGALEPRLFASP